jgi:hypothetical protein
MSNSNEHMRVYVLERYRRRKASAIAQLGGKCKRCGSTDDLQFDHIDRANKSFTLGRVLAGIAESKLQEELKKCQLLCLPCHQDKTIQELGQRKAKGEHGRPSTYRYCHCEVCRAGMRAYMKARPGDWAHGDCAYTGQGFSWDQKLLQVLPL